MGSLGVHIEQGGFAAYEETPPTKYSYRYRSLNVNSYYRCPRLRH